MKYKKIKEISLFALINAIFFTGASFFISTVYDLQFSNADTRHLGLRSYGICTLVIGMFYIYWSIPSMQLQHM